MGAVCVVGDPDSHGGAVTSGSSRTTVAGIPVAHVGSSVSPDPIPGHSGKSITGHAATGRTTVGGQAVAGNGAPVSCGASVNATHNRTFVG
jgi:uncharacterized Zn-binding protein involved in type VI secretion|nr:MAG TPA: hypothetical protein [Caudoviricetes sp.]